MEYHVPDLAEKDPEAESEFTTENERITSTLIACQPIDSDRIPEQDEYQYTSPCITGLFFDHKHSVYYDECSKCLEERIQIEANHSVYEDAEHPIISSL